MGEQTMADLADHPRYICCGQTWCKICLPVCPVCEAKKQHVALTEGTATLKKPAEDDYIPTDLEEQA